MRYRVQGFIDAAVGVYVPGYGGIVYLRHLFAAYQFEQCLAPFLRFQLSERLRPAYHR